MSCFSVRKMSSEYWYVLDEISYGSDRDIFVRVISG